MQKLKPRISGPGIIAGLGAGSAAALLSLLVAQKTAFAMVMGFLAPLPLMIAAMGFGPIAGGIAVSVGALAVGVFDSRTGGLALVAPDHLGAGLLDAIVFIVTLGLPSWLMARLAVSPIRVPKAVQSVVDPQRPEELLLGRLLTVAMAFGAISVALGFAIAIIKLGSFQAFMDDSVRMAKPFAERLLASNRPLPKDFTAQQVAVGVTWALTPLFAGVAVLLFVVNLWFAARIAQMSGLLTGYWPDISRYTRVQRPLALVFAMSLGLSLAGGIVGMASLVVCGALLMGFVLQGLAVTHAVTRGKTYRRPLLIIVYLSMLLLMPWLLAFYGLIGLLDAAFAFRDREKPAPQTPGPWQRPPAK